MPRSGGIGRTGQKHKRGANPGPCSRSDCKKKKSRVVSEQPNEPTAELFAKVPSFLDTAVLQPVQLYRRPAGHHLCECDGTSPFCRIRWCYASEIGMCESRPFFNVKEASWELPMIDECVCMNWDDGAIPYEHHIPYPDLFPDQRVVNGGCCRVCDCGGPFIGFINGNHCEDCRPDLYPPDW